MIRDENKQSGLIRGLAMTVGLCRLAVVVGTTPWAYYPARVKEGNGLGPRVLKSADEI